MPGVVLPPFAAPTGPELSREKLLDAWLEGARTGFSAELHIEDRVLLVDRSVPFGGRLGLRSVLIRTHMPGGLGEIKTAVEDHLRARGLECLEPEARLAEIAGIQVTGVRGALWDLWGDDRARAQEDLQRAALGDDILAVQESSIGTAGDAGVGMTLDELLGGDQGDREL